MSQGIWKCGLEKREWGVTKGGEGEDREEKEKKSTRKRFQISGV